MKKSIHPGTVILVGFGAMILFMIYLVYQCNQNPVVMVSKNYYDQELVYQQQIDARNNLKQTGDSVQYERTGDQLSFKVPTQINQHMEGMDISFHHHANAALDMEFHPTQNAAGVYLLPVDKKMRGTYRVAIKMNSNNKKYEDEVEITL